MADGPPSRFFFCFPFPIATPQKEFLISILYHETARIARGKPSLFRQNGIFLFGKIYFGKMAEFP
jgi:hypothetical protein